MIEIYITIEETEDGNIALSNRADGTATELEADFATRFRDMVTIGIATLYDPNEATAQQTKCVTDIQRFTQN